MIHLEDSSFYQVLLKEGREEGRKQGEISGARKFLIHQGRIRFGRLPKATRAAIEAIDDLQRLERLSEQLLTATSWADLLAETR
jgi:predicted transposase YdaD